MKTEINKLKVTFQGRELIIDLEKELSIKEDLINSQLKASPSSYYVLCSLRDELWIYYKDSNPRWNNDYVTHKVNSSKKYCSVYSRYLKAVDKANQFIAICRAYENREAILRSLNANLRKG